MDDYCAGPTPPVPCLPPSPFERPLVAAAEADLSGWMWALLLFGIVVGYALCFVTLVPYVWRVRFRDGVLARRTRNQLTNNHDRTTR